MNKSPDAPPAAAAAMPALPPPLAAVVEAPTPGGKRERTQGQLVQAAFKVFGTRGVAAATIQEVAQVAGMTPGTVYNHFSTKEALIERVALTLAETLCRAIADSHAHVADGAERMAIGQRRYIWLAAQSPAWALLLLDVARASPHLAQLVEKYPLADLRLGVKQKAFKVPSEAAALDAISGICTAAMLRVALGQAPRNHDVAAATLVLRALGMPPEAAAEVAKRPLPAL
ncbi:MAG: TetR/AcrR family transcriptional regulator [Pseudomonadota bacterium]